jgi:nondiscriminating glutamyl-tRNA synthetase
LVAAGKLPENPTEPDREYAKKLISLYHEQMSYAAEIVPLSEMFFAAEITLDDEAKEVIAAETAPIVLAAFKEKLVAIEPFEEAGILAAIKEVQKETKIKGKNLYMAIRIAVSGQMHGPEIGKTIEVLGREKSLAHLNSVLENL